VVLGGYRLFAEVNNPRSVFDLSRRRLPHHAGTVTANEPGSRFPAGCGAV